MLVAPDKFAGTLTAVEAARAIADGWRRRAPEDDLDLAPMADGGPGFVDVLHAALGGDLAAVTVSGPHGEPTPGAVLLAGDRAWVESAQACGLALTGGERAESATTWGVGELVMHAIDAGATDITVGLGGSGTNDGGAGLLGALGATADRPLDEGAAGLAGLTEVDLAPARARVDGIRLTCASDVDSPLTGLFGATKTFGPQKGIPEERLPAVDGVLEELAAATDRRTSLEKGAGAAGGLGFALLLLGARRRPGFDVVADAVDLPARARGPTWWSPARARSTSPAAPARCRTASRRSPPRRSGRASRWPARCWSAPARCARSASSRRTPWSTSSARSGRSATRPTASPTSPRGWRAPGRGDGRSGSRVDREE